jgi:uncharacterized protein
MDRDQASLDFDEIANILLGQGIDCSPSELHGCVTGQLASGLSAPAESYLNGVSQVLDINMHGPLVEAGIAMIVNIAEQLSDEGFAFQPLIPDDDTELSQRVDALGQWCQGLLAGFALGMAQTGGADTGSPALSVEVSETLSDLSAISQAGFDEEEEHDQAEQDFFDVLEYSRLAALSLYMEHTQKDPVPAGGSDSIGSPAGLFGKKLH